jgi:hypothetical protein
MAQFPGARIQGECLETVETRARNRVSHGVITAEVIREFITFGLSNPGRFLMG